MRRIQRRGDTGKRWLTFLQNHREGIAAFDLFTVPTVTFQLLYRFSVIEHRRRKILRFNVARHSSAAWVIQQLREAFPEAAPYRSVMLDRDSKFDKEVITSLKATGLTPKRTSVEAPWRNGLAERWMGNCRREIPDHVIALSQRHLHRLIRDSVNSYHEDRNLDSLEKDTPYHRPIEQKPVANATAISMPRLGGLCRRYGWRADALNRSAPFCDRFLAVTIQNDAWRRHHRTACLAHNGQRPRGRIAPTVLVSICDHAGSPWVCSAPQPPV